MKFYLHRYLVGLTIGYCLLFIPLSDKGCIFFGMYNFMFEVGTKSLPTVFPRCRHGRACVNDPWGYAVEPLMPAVQGEIPD